MPGLFFFFDCVPSSCRYESFPLYVLINKFKPVICFFSTHQYSLEIATQIHSSYCHYFFLCKCQIIVSPRVLILYISPSFLQVKFWRWQCYSTPGTSIFHLSPSGWTVIQFQNPILRACLLGHLSSFGFPKSGARDEVS